MREIPDSWASAAERRGIRQTMRGVAEAAGITPSTLSRFLNGGRMGQEKVAALAAALALTAGDVYASVHRPAPGEQWAPEAARWLHADERAALEQLIRVVTTGRGQPARAQEPSAEPGRQARGWTPRQVERALTQARATRAALIAENEPDLYGAAVADLTATIARLEAEAGQASSAQSRGA